MNRLGKIIKTAMIAVPIAAVAACLPAATLAALGQPQSAIVVFARHIDPSSLPANIAILSWSDHVARLDGVDATTARKLYVAGAALVMPFRKSGCLSSRKT